MIEKAIYRLNYIIEQLPRILAEMGEEKLSEKPLPNKWSKKEILGHLIDSATNNHQRFVRGQFETIPEIGYDQNNWNRYGFYQMIDSEQLIDFWAIYNKQLVEIIKRIPSEKLKNKIKVGDNTLTIEFLIADYVEHLDHHLKQLRSF